MCLAPLLLLAAGGCNSSDEGEPVDADCVTHACDDAGSDSVAFSDDSHSDADAESSAPAEDSTLDTFDTLDREEVRGDCGDWDSYWIGKPDTRGFVPCRTTCDCPVGYECYAAPFGDGGACAP